MTNVEMRKIHLRHKKVSIYVHGIMNEWRETVHQQTKLITCTYITLVKQTFEWQSRDLKGSRDKKWQQASFGHLLTLCKSSGHLDASGISKSNTHTALNKPSIKGWITICRNQARFLDRLSWTEMLKVHFTGTNTPWCRRDAAVMLVTILNEK